MIFPLSFPFMPTKNFGIILLLGSRGTYVPAAGTPVVFRDLREKVFGNIRIPPLSQ